MSESDKEDADGGDYDTEYSQISKTLDSEMR